MLHKQRHFSPDDYVPKTYGYGRVSHKKQFDAGNSIEDQEKRILAYYEMRKMDAGHPMNRSEWAGMHSEPRAQSAYSRPFRKRPAGSALAELLKPGDFLIIDKLDRLFRNLEDFVVQTRYFTEWGIGVHFVSFLGLSVDTTSSGGKLMLDMFAIFSELESTRISERVSMARASRRMAKMHSGVPTPFFCQYVGGDGIKTRGGTGRLEFKPWAQDLMAKITYLRDEEGKEFAWIGHVGLVAELDKAIGHSRGTRRANKVSWLYWFRAAWLDAGSPDLNTLKFAEFVAKYKRSRKNESQP